MANHKSITTNTHPTWVFIQQTASGEYRHEIRYMGDGVFKIFVNVCDENGGGVLLPDKFATYFHACGALFRFRPGSKLSERINRAGKYGIPL